MEGSGDAEAEAQQQPGTADRTGGPSEVAETITTIAGAITASAAFIVIPGAAILLIRLQDAELPANLGVITSLPPQLLLGTGLGYIFFPLLVAIALVLAVVFVPGPRGSANPALVTGQPEGRRPLRALALVAFVANVGAGYLFFDPQNVFGWAALLLGAALVAVCLVLALRRLVWGRRDLRRPSRIAFISLVASLFFLPAAFLWGGSRALEAATVCLEDGTRVDGVLVAQTSDRVHVGEAEHRVAMFFSADSPEAVDIQPTMRNLGYDVRRELSPLLTGLERIDLAVGLLRDVDPNAEALIPEEDADVIDHNNLVSLFPRPEGEEPRLDGYELSRLLLEEVPVVVFEADALATDAAEAFGVHVEDPGLVNRDELQGVISGLVDADPREQPDRRIISLPAGRVSRVAIGGVGSCPATPGAGE